MADDEAQGRVAATGEGLRHYDRAQLAYQLGEIAGERTYLRHGIEVGEGDVVLDVGANVGVAAAFFASQCGAGAVHSFEPVRPLFELLRENVARYPSCVAHPYGLAAAGGRAKITYYPAAAAMSGLYADPREDREIVRRCLLNLGLSDEDAEHELRGRYETITLDCELRTLSSVLAEESLDEVHLLKIDVERAELDVLRGIDDADWPIFAQVVAEVHDENGRLAAVAERLRRWGLRVKIDQEPMMRGTPVHMVYARRA